MLSHTALEICLPFQGRSSNPQFESLTTWPFARKIYTLDVYLFFFLTLKRHMMVFWLTWTKKTKVMGVNLGLRIITSFAHHHRTQPSSKIYVASSKMCVQKICMWWTFSFGNGKVVVCSLEFSAHWKFSTFCDFYIKKIVMFGLQRFVVSFEDFVQCWCMGSIQHNVSIRPCKTIENHVWSWTPDCMHNLLL